MVFKASRAKTLQNSPLACHIAVSIVAKTKKQAVSHSNPYYPLEIPRLVQTFGTCFGCARASGVFSYTGTGETYGLVGRDSVAVLDQAVTIERCASLDVGFGNKSYSRRCLSSPSFGSERQGVRAGCDPWSSRLGRIYILKDVWPNGKCGSIVSFIIWTQVCR